MSFSVSVFENVSFNPFINNLIKSIQNNTSLKSSFTSIMVDREEGIWGTAIYTFEKKMSSSEDDGCKVRLKGQYMRLDLSCISIQDISYHNDTLKQQQSSGRHIQRRDSPSGEVCFLFSQFSGTCLEIWIAFKYHLSESVSQLVLVYLLSIVKPPLPILRASLHQLNPLLLIRILPSSINEY